MSLDDYHRSAQLADNTANSFPALLMAAMQRADGHNLELLQRAFPLTWGQLAARWHASGGDLGIDLCGCGDPINEGDGWCTRGRHHPEAPHKTVSAD